MMQAVVLQIRLIAALLVLVSTCTGCMLLHIPARTKPLQHYGFKLTGPEPLDCGRWLLGTNYRDTLQEAFQCAQMAIHNGTPFYFRQNALAIDSVTNEGLLLKPDGALMHYHYDSRPCGNPYWRERFIVGTVRIPALKNNRHGSSSCVMSLYAAEFISGWINGSHVRRLMKVLVVSVLMAIATPAQDSDLLQKCITKADTQSSMNRCASEEGSRVEAALNQLLKELLAAARNDKNAVAKINAAERAWKAYRDSYMEAMFPADNKQARYGSIYPMSANLFQAKLTRQHIEDLKTLFQEHYGR
jgi:uncharacterized protein YecT (DUF1311 family)